MNNKKMVYKNPYDVRSNLNDLGWYWIDVPGREPEGGDWFKDGVPSRDTLGQWEQDLWEANKESHREMKRRESS